MLRMIGLASQVIKTSPPMVTADQSKDTLRDDKRETQELAAIDIW